MFAEEEYDAIGVLEAFLRWAAALSQCGLCRDTGRVEITCPECHRGSVGEGRVRAIEAFGRLYPLDEALRAHLERLNPRRR